MSEQVLYTVRDGVARLTIDNPPVNALSHPLRVALQEAVQTALDDPGIGALVIRAEGRTFPAGSDLRDYDHHGQTPTLGTLCDMIEASPKPVVAAIHGTALGGGFELALACHYRLVETTARLGFPDVGLGLVPSAGGSQRLPRIVGAKAALDMLVTGRPVDAETAERIGLADKVILKNLDAAAVASARNLATAGSGPRPTRNRQEGLSDPAAFLAEIEARRARVAKDPRDAVHRAVDLVEAALLLPFDAGLEMERASFEDLVDSDQSRGLRHAFLAERRTTRVPQLAARTPRGVERIGVVGGGRLGAGIVRACLAAGFPLTLVERDDAALAAARGRIEAGLERDVDRGRVSPARREAQLDALQLTTDPGALGAVDLVIEAVTEDAATKRAVFETLGRVTEPGTVLVSAGLGPDLAALAGAAGRPEDVMGLRFFAPAHRVRLVEVVCPEAAASDLAATGVAVAHKLGKVPVVPGAGGESVALPVFSALFSAVAGVLLSGTDPRTVDAALRGHGFALGPLQLADLAGLDRLAALGWQGLGGALLEEMADAGFVGQKAGRGFYGYGQGNEPGSPTLEFGEIVEALRAEMHIAPAQVLPEEIAERAVLAMVNAGAKLVERGIAQRPSDVDAAMITGFAYPRWRGGPMETADLRGLVQVRNRLRALAETGQGDLFTPAPLFDELIKTGMTFDRLSAGEGLSALRTA